MLESHVSSELTVAASEYVKEGEYWLKKLSGNLVKTSFPYDQFHAGTIDGTSIQSMQLEIPQQCCEKMMWISKGGDHTLHMILVTAVVLLLHKYTGQQDIILGAPIYKQEIEGEFVNTVLALRNYIESHMSFKELLLQVRQTILAANENQNYPMETLLFRLNIPFSGSDFPLFDVGVLLENIHDRKYIEHTRPNMIFSFSRTEEAVKGLLEFNPLLYELSSAARIAAHFTALLREVLFQVDLPAAQINILSEQEREQQLFVFNHTTAAYPSDQTIHGLIRLQADRTPDNIALQRQIPNKEGTRGLAPLPINVTYKELDQKSNQLANYLKKEINIQPGDRVGILMDNSMELVTALLGILKAGAAYVPMDPVLPEERIKRIIDDAYLGVVISLKKNIRTLNRLQWECASFDIFMCLDSSDIYGEEETEQNELMDQKLWDYVAETAVDEITGGGWNSSYTGQPFSKQEMDEYGDNVLQKLLPILHHDMRVLEIGCASGITMYRIAPRVGYYHGTDLSDKIIQRNKEQVKAEGHTNINLTHVPAHHIETIDDKNFNLVILNSVIQSFHGHNYLRKVIRKSINLLGEQGYLFVGDIMDHDLKDALIEDLMQFKRTTKDKTLQTKTDFSTELFVSRGFFKDLQVDMPEIKGLELSRKIFIIKNELTKYRYDALITVDKTGKTRDKTGEKQKYQQDLTVLAGYGAENPDCAVTPCDPAYVIYTSGTTGTPRGVMIQHRSLVNYTWWAVKTYMAGETTPVTVPLYSSISFDLTVTSIYLPLLTGGTIIIYSSEDHRFPVQQIVKDDRVDILKATPSHLRLLQQEITGNNLKLKTFIVGGEELERVLAQNIYLGFSRRVDIYNEYGPTEATVGCMIYKFNYEKDRRRSVSIGLPADNVTIYILDPGLNPVPLNGIGEIYIGGDALARGYVNQPELTAEKFLSLFYRSYRSYKSYISKRLYKTGDLARRLPDGNIEFLGRMDEQVKIRGYRIELKEIESQLLTHSDVKEAVVITKETSHGKSPGEAGDKALCAYIVPERDVEISELIAYLSVRLPDYMVPSYFMPVEQIPLTPNGKVDGKALPEPKIQGTDDTYAAPETKTQVTLMEIWSKVLGIEKSVIGIETNFFELGGHSLKATILIAEIHKALDVKVPLAEIFKHPFIRELSDYIDRTAVEKFSHIEPGEKKEYYVLSSAQKRLYILQQMGANSIGYNESVFLVLEGRLDKGKFEHTFQKLIMRHESLRTGFHMVKGEPVQRVYDEVQFQIEYNGDNEGTGGLAPLSIPAEEKAGTHHSFVRPFDLTRAPLFRVGLTREEQEMHILMVDIHHIVTDGFSMGILTKDFMTLYKGEDLLPLRIQYKDFSQWQNSEMGRKMLAEQEAYWLEEFRADIPQPDLPTDYPRPLEKMFAGNRMGFDLDIDQAGKLRECARQEKATLYMVLLAVFNILLSKLSGSEDIVVGTPSAGRRHADLQSIIGMFVNTLAIRNYPLHNQTFNDFLAEVKEQTLKAFENQDYPFEDLVEKAGVIRDTSRNPIFETVFALQNMEFPILEIPQLRLLPYRQESGISKFDISLHGSEAGDGILFVLEYSTKIFKPETITRIIGYFKKIVSSVAAMPGRKISEIDLISEQEKKQVLYDFNCTEVSCPKDKIITGLFETQVQRTPDHIAVVGPMQIKYRTHMTYMTYLSYKELDETSNRMAQWLRGKGVQPDTMVGIMLERSVEMLVTILAILKAGGAYLPIEPEYPRDRITYMLKDSSAKILVTDTGLSEKFEKLLIVNCQLLMVDEMALNRRRLNNPPQEANSINNYQLTINNLQLKQANLAYIIYTSGSTGKPKGVMIEHQALVNYIWWAAKNYVREDKVNFPLYTAISFDLTVTSIFTPLVTGNAIVVYNEEEKGILIEKIIEENRVGVVKLTPAHLRLISEIMLNRNTDSHRPMLNIKRFIVGGEKLDSRLALDIHEVFRGQVEIYNEYGPTEATIGCMIYKFDPAANSGDSVPIGIPADNVRIYLLDREQKPVPIGVVGEIFISGAGVARGYLRQPELSQKTFLPNPFVKNERLYKTGDLARWLPDGNAQFLGRIDEQVKIRGYRIELAEIESCLLNNDEITAAVVVAREKENEPGNRFLCAYIVADKNKVFMVSELRMYLAGQLPDYMIPSYFVPIDRIPLTANGKLDKNALPQPPGVRPHLKENYVPPGTEIEKQITGIWLEVLKLDKVGINDRFFELGGNSLNIIQVNSKLKKVLGKDVPVMVMFRYTTIGSLAHYLSQQGMTDTIDRERRSQLQEKGKRITQQRYQKRKQSRLEKRGEN